MESVWHEIKSNIKERLPAHCYKMWIEPVGIGTSDNSRIELTCPNDFYRKRVQDNYGSLIKSEFAKKTGKQFKIKFCVATAAVKTATSIKPVKPAPEPVTHQMELPRMGAAYHCGRMLKKDFTFDRFIVGGNNDFAYSAALSLATGKKSYQNSVFMVSQTGNGKSHLSQAVGNQILSSNPSDRVYYVTAEDFTNEMVGALKRDDISGFKDKYRNQCDVLLLEDVHFLTGKERTQAELSMTLDYLMDLDKRIIFSSCYQPSEIPKINDQLQSRLSSGVITQIDTPDFKTRVKIVKQKAVEKGETVSRDVQEYLAGELTENIRQLESGLVGVIVRSSLMGIPIDLKLAEDVVKTLTTRKKVITIDVIKKLVCREYNITLDEMISKSRKQSVVKPRQMAIYLSRRYTDQPLQSIGKNFNRYHATAIHAIGAVEKALKDNVAIRKQYEYLTKKLDSGKF